MGMRSCELRIADISWAFSILSKRKIILINAMQYLLFGS